ncbi:MAG TPA: heme ABC exporter ATP-binding protein CcmA [Hyphomicrobiaceae bacterium]|nr:heme ABC exporter ATP-binding protein CcmA [Hyphomicrobiaceae bacterium]
MELIAEKLCARRGGRILFAGISFSVDAGEALLVTGPNGAGKTTLLRAIAGFLPLEDGTIRLDGAGADMSIAEQCHYVGHANAVKPSLTVAENAAFWMGFLGGPKLDEAHAAASPPYKEKGDPAESAEAGAPLSKMDPLDDALEAFNLAPLRDIPVGYLSAGQKRRVGLMRLALAERPLWLLDEPTASLDSASQERLGRVVNKHLAGGGLVVAATHLPLDFARTHELRLGRPAAAAAA